MKNISRAVLVLSFVSLFTDFASELLYPVLPIYFQSIGFSIFFIGILEGFAEAIAGLSKGYFGRQSDRLGRRVVFVRVGYSLSALAKPLMGMLVLPLWVFFARTMDRVGKGIRTGARDAILSDESTAETRGAVFGFHRAMDTFGAVLGPLTALIYLWIFPGRYKMLFYIAFVPGLLAVLVTFLLKEKHATKPTSSATLPASSFLRFIRSSSTDYKRVLSGLLLFSLINSSDVFLLLKAREAGIGDVKVIFIYIAYNLVYAIFAYPLGKAADRIGIKRIFSLGLLLFAVVYFGMGLTQSFAIFLGLFFIYGVYAAATEGISKAWLTNVSGSNEMATALGTFAGLQSICTLLSSSIAGLIWYRFGQTALFVYTGCAAVFVLVYMSVFTKEVNRTKAK